MMGGRKEGREEGNKKERKKRGTAGPTQSLFPPKDHQSVVILVNLQ